MDKRFRALEKTIRSPSETFSGEKGKQKFINSYRKASPEHHDMLVNNIKKTIAANPSERGRSSLMGRWKKVIAWHEEMAANKRNGMIYEAKQEPKYKSGPAELSDDIIKKKRKEFASWDRKKHLSQAKEHDEGAKHWFKNGVDSVAAHKQLLWARFHRDEAKRKTTPLGNLARMVGLAENVEVWDHDHTVGKYDNFPDAEAHAIEASKKPFGNHATNGRFMHVRQIHGRGKVTTHSYFGGVPVATVVKVNNKVTGEGYMHRTLSMPRLGLHHGERYAASGGERGVKKIYEAYADIYAKDVLGIENLDEVVFAKNTGYSGKQPTNYGEHKTDLQNYIDFNHFYEIIPNHSHKEWVSHIVHNDATIKTIKTLKKYKLNENYVEHNGDVYRIDKVAHKKFTFTLKRNGVKEPMVRTYDNIHDARNAMTMAMRNINTKQNVTESSKDYHLNEFREHVLRYKRALNSKDFFSAAQHKMNAIQYWRAYIGGKNSNPPPEELQEIVDPLTVGGFVAGAVGSKLIGDAAHKFLYGDKAAERHAKTHAELQALRKDAEEAKEYAAKAASTASAIHSNNYYRTLIGKPPTTSAPVEKKWDAKTGRDYNGVLPHEKGYIKPPPSVKLQWKNPQQKSFGGLFSTIHEEDKEEDKKPIPFRKKKKGYGRDRADWALPPSSDDDIRLEVPDNTVPFKK